jgi:hypothetical protein
MRNKQSMDDLFQKGADGFKIDPPVDGWKKLESEYFGNKSPNSQFYWGLAVVAVILLLFFGIMYFNNVSELENNTFSEQGKNATINQNSQEQNYDRIENGYKYTSEAINDNENQIIIEENENEQNSGIDEQIFGMNRGTIKSGFNPESERSKSLFKMNKLTVNGLQSDYDIRLSEFYNQALEKTIERKNRIKLYTGLGITTGKIFYPTTKDQFTYSADLAFGINIRQFYFETGINYQEMKEEGYVNVEFSSQDSVGFYNQVLSFEVDPFSPGNIIYNTQKTTVFEEVMHYTVTYPVYKYKYLDFPLLFGYQFYDKNKISLAGQVGFVFSTLIEKIEPEISFTDPEYKLIKLVNQTPERVNNNCQFQFALRLGYQFKPAVSIVAEPVFSKYLNSIYSNNYPILKPYEMGLRFGIYYNF